MDIRKGASYPAGNLSNFTPYRFVIDGVECSSMEGFLQSLKFSNVEMQKYICTLSGQYAKSKGAQKNWRKNQTLFWNDVSIKRESIEYQLLLDKAFDALSKNEKFRRALLSTQNATLTHSLGKKKITDTVLTQQEFCSRLTKIRSELK